jgi:ArsR family transcriptional regulator
MATAKTESFEAADTELAALAKALAHPARIAILKLLAKRNTCVCGDIVDELPLAQATVSQHLKELKEAGLIRGTISGPRVCYCLDYAALQKAQARFQDLFKVQLEPSLNCNC